ncbi:protein kinase domain-containing protein [Frankia sp. Cas3]|uniref:protein kinase domain-containing protein n=1 Tax=Frankia sp. Cas3 TaxID=3073926 RepID=UPI002AD2F142|nr:protein kinase [Frankia sp. Cas3]
MGSRGYHGIPGTPAVRGVVLRARVRGGGAGEVWAGRVVATGAECVVRRVRLPPDAAARDAAMRAAQVLLGLSHPHLLPVIDVVATAEGLAVVAEPVVGAISLGHLLETRDRLDPGEVVTVGLPVAQALAAAHAAGVVHGQLDPDDVLLEPNGRPVLAGVGVAGLAGASATPAVDVSDLASLLLAAMPQATGPDAAAVAVAVAPALVDDPVRRPTAEELVAALAHSATPLPVRFVNNAVTPLPLPPLPPPPLPPPPPGVDDAHAEPAERGPRPGPAARTTPRPIRAPRTTHGAVGASTPRASILRTVTPRTYAPRTSTLGGPAADGEPAAALAGPRRIWAVVAVLAVIGVLTVSGLLVLVRSGPQRARPLDASPAARVSPEQVWRDVIAGLDNARNQAFEQADEAGIAGVDAPGSTAYARDVALIRQIVALGGHAVGLHQEILDLVIRETGSEKSVLRITYRRLPYTYVDKAGTVLARQPGHDRLQSDVTLVRTEQGWRVATQVDAVA